MNKLLSFNSTEQLDAALANKVAELLKQAVNKKGKASIALSGGSTPKGFFKALSKKELPWDKITVTLADERWVNIDSDASNTRLIHENLLQDKAKEAQFFHLKQGEELSPETLAELNSAAKSSILPLDILILGMGEDGHTASIFPCSEQLQQALKVPNDDALMKTEPKTAPHQRITFTFANLMKSENTFLHISGRAKKQVLDKALSDTDTSSMPIRAFLQHPDINTQVYWAE